MIFNGEEVRAILEGRKTQTRVVIKPQPQEGWLQRYWHPKPGDMIMSPKDGDCRGYIKHCPHGQPGDLLWVRETFRVWAPGSNEYPNEQDVVEGPLGAEFNLHYHHRENIQYKATADDSEEVSWRPSIHMPRWASRIDLRFTGVRVERLQEITIENVRDEGCKTLDQVSQTQFIPTYQDFIKRWDSTAKPEHKWDKNPWVWVIEFKKI